MRKLLGLVLLIPLVLIGCDSGLLTSGDTQTANAANRAIRIVNVSTAAQLTSALAAAQAGDDIVLAAGTTFTGFFKGNANGTAANPIVIESASATSKAILNGTSPGGGASLQITGDYWTVKNLKLTNSQKALVFDNANFGQAINCEMYNIGNEALHFRDGSKNGLADGCYIHDTGVVNAGYGEGIYVGTDKASWDTYLPDVYDTVIRNCTIGPNVRAEHLDIKEGTLRTIVKYCTFNGTGMGDNGAVANSATGFVAAKGADAIIRYNTGRRNGNPVITDAFHINNRGVVNSGTGNWFYNNTLYLDDATAWVVHRAQGDCTYQVWNNTRSPAGNLYETASGTTYTVVDPGIGATPTATPAGGTPTPNPTATPSPTPAATPTPGTSSLTFQYSCADTAASTKSIKPDIKIINGGSSAVLLETIKVRYYFSDDGKQPVFPAVRYVAGVSAANVVQSVSSGAGNRYAEISFKTGSGSIAAGAEVQVKITINDDTFELFTQTGDYSFDAAKTGYANHTKITGYVGGALVWGTTGP